jgi:8-oxo-dGTP pyrophosphatase MutT (NUDIX family)
MKTRRAKFGFATFVYLFNKDFSKILLIKRNREKREKYGADWGNIGGKIELGEVSIQACLREAKEEAGLQLDPKKTKLVDVKEIIHEETGEYAIHFRYSAILDEHVSLTLNNESESYKWFDISDLPNNMFESKEEIFQMMNVAKKLF